MKILKRLVTEDKLVLNVPARHACELPCCDWWHSPWHRAERWLCTLPLLARVLALPRAACPGANVATSGSWALRHSLCLHLLLLCCSVPCGMGRVPPGHRLAQGGQERQPMVLPDPTVPSALGHQNLHPPLPRMTLGALLHGVQQFLVFGDVWPQTFLLEPKSDSPVSSRCFLPFRSASNSSCTVQRWV